MSAPAPALTAVAIQRLLRSVDAELHAHPKPSAERLSRMLERLAPAHRPGFYSVSVTSPISGRGVLLSQLWYQLTMRLEEAEELERSRRAG